WRVRRQLRSIRRFAPPVLKAVIEQIGQPFGVDISSENPGGSTALRAIPAKLSQLAERETRNGCQFADRGSVVRMPRVVQRPQEGSMGQNRGTLSLGLKAGDRLTANALPFPIGKARVPQDVDDQVKACLQVRSEALKADVRTVPP